MKTEGKEKVEAKIKNCSFDDTFNYFHANNYDKVKTLQEILYIDDNLNCY